jgi:DNA-binding SARP family transcriptional activator
MFSVRMLGVFSISIDGRRVTDDLGPCGRNLCAYLFQFIGRVHRREGLADRFWQHLDPERARAALNTALWRFRKLLASDPSNMGEQNIHTAGSDVTIDPAPWLDIDSIRFETAVKRLLSTPQQVNGDICLGELERSVDCYSGPFLDGEDADWILEERERLHSLYIRGLSELIREYAQIERYDEAIASARRILSLDPFRESVHRDLEILLVLNGQRGDALRQHERWSALFQKELGINPMPETLRLIESIRSGQIFDQLNELKVRRFCRLHGATASARPDRLDKTEKNHMGTLTPTDLTSFAQPSKHRRFRTRSA